MSKPLPTQYLMTPIAKAQFMAELPYDNDEALAEARMIVRDLTEVLPHFSELEYTPEIDFEDFWEAAFRISAAQRAAKLHGGSLEIKHTSQWSTQDRANRLGPVRKDEESAHAFDRLSLPKLVQKHGGRTISYATVPDIDENGNLRRPVKNNIYDILLNMFAQGVEYAVVKSRITKGGIITIPLSSDIAEMNHQLLSSDEIFGWHIVANIEQEDAFVVQEWIPMNDEYRFFIVDGQIITGAATIEEHTPFNRSYHAAAFAEEMNQPYLDTHVRGIRENNIREIANDGSAYDRQIRRDASLVHEIYKPFVEDVVIPELTLAGINTVVVDVATGTNGEPIVIELNGLTNSGLYASDPYALMRALVVAKDRGYSL